MHSDIVKFPESSSLHLCKVLLKKDQWSEQLTRYRVDEGNVSLHLKGENLEGLQGCGG